MFFSTHSLKHETAYHKCINDWLLYLPTVQPTAILSTDKLEQNKPVFTIGPEIHGLSQFTTGSRESAQSVNIGWL